MTRAFYFRLILRLGQSPTDNHLKRPRLAERDYRAPSRLQIGNADGKCNREAPASSIDREFIIRS